MTIQIYEIASQMCREGLDERFVSAVVKGAFESEAIANAMIFWTHAVTQEKKDRRVALLSELVENIDDETTAEIEINCINSMQVVAEIQKFKATLKAKIEASVGISGLSKEIGIPVPGIRAFLESSARPRKMTLEKIRHALHLPQSDLSCPFAV
jgi:sulfur relay (sulfurtransferase) complex TusBCD TusD component (DsrE family)